MWRDQVVERPDVRHLPTRRDYNIVQRMRDRRIRGQAHAVVTRAPFPVPQTLYYFSARPLQLNPILKSHSISPVPPQAGHAPAPPHLSQSPSCPDSTAAPTSTPVPPHALHLPPPPHSVQGFDRAVITHPLGVEAEPLAGNCFFIPHTPHASTRPPVRTYVSFHAVREPHGQRRPPFDGDRRQQPRLDSRDARDSGWPSGHMPCGGGARGSDGTHEDEHAQRADTCRRSGACRMIPSPRTFFR
jgi:hypothetical protein